MSKWKKKHINKNFVFDKAIGQCNVKLLHSEFNHQTKIKIYIVFYHFWL